METRILRIDPVNPDYELISEAGWAIRQGMLVGFPTETVYGLAADALNPDAVARVFEAKGRPLDKPLPIQVADESWIVGLVSEVPAAARRLMNSFFPGPLTIIMKAAPWVSPMITSGTGKIGIRMADHVVAMAFLKAAGMPIVAPSANTSGFNPPLNAETLMNDLGGKIEYILDAGACNLMVASTVVDITESPWRILRAGLISEDMIRAVSGME